MNSIRKATERTPRITTAAKHALYYVGSDGGTVRVLMDVRTRTLPRAYVVLRERGLITLRHDFARGTTATITDAGREYLRDMKG